MPQAYPVQENTMTLAYRAVAGVALALVLAASNGCAQALRTGEPAVAGASAEDLAREFQSPPDSARPWVYWFWMDGNLSREGITADLEAMQRAGIGGMVIMEVDVGIPRGPVKFMSPQWRALFKHAVTEAQRLGLQITLNAGPGWTGSGGPWVKPEQSMQHLVASSIEVSGPAELDRVLPRPAPRDPHFVHVPVPPQLEKARKEFYRDVAVIAFPTPAKGPRIADVDEKALYYRNPFSSMPGVKPHLPSPAEYPATPAGTAIAPQAIVDLTDRLGPDGRLTWKVPPGEWTILRFGRTTTGANTRPSPEPAIGFESDKMDKAALEAHFEAFVGTLMKELAEGDEAGEVATLQEQEAGKMPALRGGEAGKMPALRRRQVGWTMLHIDSWEMGSQNWTAAFRDEFRRRRGYDPLPYLPAMLGHVVESLEISERFLWDLRQTVNELIVENHAAHLRELAHRHGFGLSIEPYDLTPCADMSLGGMADVPMCEFWSEGYGFETTFSCIEATSIAHTLGRPIVAAEAFTANHEEAWKLHPGNMKRQADWALCFGINRIVFHRYAHQPWLDRWPGMTMGPYGIHYERTQTWWELSSAWHTYLSRCQHLLRQGVPVADICYLSAEGAPHVFRPPPSALGGSQTLPDRRGYNFDGCTPETLLQHMSVKNGRLTLPEGMSYRVLVLPKVETMTPALLGKVKDLAEAGATVIGAPPLKSPGLSDYPRCDEEVKRIARELWGDDPAPTELTERRVGRGRVFWSSALLPDTALEQAGKHPLAGAKWIWHPEGNPAASAPAGKRYFRRIVSLGAEERVKAARLSITADNSFELWVNGRRAGSGNNFHHAFDFDVAASLRPGENIIAVAAENGVSHSVDAPNPAGMIAALRLQLGDGSIREVCTDRAWKTAVKVSDGWLTDASAEGEWLAAMELGPLGAGPWGAISGRAQQFDIYPDYDVTAAVLTKLNVPPDFQSDKPLRYIHRRTDDADIYFLANPDAQAVQANCDFRAAGRSVEIWDPVTGKTRAAANPVEQDGRTLLSLNLEPVGSVFVMFLSGQADRKMHGTSASGDLPVYESMPLDGPWLVRFQPGRGAPGELTFDALLDWSKHPDPGVKYFSGTAVYTKTFKIPEDFLGRGKRLELDLGRVEVMAQVKLNGRDLGILWTPPFRIDMTEAAQAGENKLEITVANLWPNRLIGDKSLPEEKRVAWSTWNPYRADSPLLASGLIGPVTLRAANE
jgi:hypothetical protein